MGNVGWEALLYARSRVVHAAAGAGVDVIDVPFLDLNDMDGMKREAEAARALGFCGKGSIHPKQVPVLNEIFTPTEAEFARHPRAQADQRRLRHAQAVVHQRPAFQGRADERRRQDDP
ncbi:Citryl-CoA lyase [alpha proteobacterium BAL199]|nr:Citryl-CoA lyase [alpha proteobacterium BAL199]